MSRRSGLWGAAARCAESGAECALATVSRQRGSLPMASDAKMLVTRDGRASGTVGGGCVESDVIAQAIETLNLGAPRFVKHTLNADVAGDIGLSCGGTVELFLEPIPATSSMIRLLDAVAAGIGQRERVAVCTALDAGVGVKFAYIGESTYTATDQPAPFDLASVWSASGSGTYVDQTTSMFVERIPRQPRVVVFGAGHVGAQIAKVAAGAGFHVVVVDDREEFANTARVPDAHEVIVADFSDVLNRIRLDEDDYVIAATRGHSYDATIVQLTAASPARYVGMLGSKRKRAVIFRVLEKAGLDPAQLKRVRSPIGVEIGADDPAEIAVSVVAELIRSRRLGEP